MGLSSSLTFFVEMTGTGMESTRGERILDGGGD
jgi:hypothetical protein